MDMQTMQTVLGHLDGVVTLLLIIGFLWMVRWAYSSRRKRDFDEAAAMPLVAEGLIDERSKNDRGAGQ